MLRNATLATLVAAVLTMLPQPQGATAAPAPGARLLQAATALSTTWGRCPTARPAHVALRQARRSHRRVRVHRARRALRAWRVVRVECRRPTPSMPVARPGR